ncbi:hypothetical protein [Thermococcus paralvinellae]|nr:hypothetical protein [Thermococcus paralvinellae]
MKMLEKVKTLLSLLIFEKKDSVVPLPVGVEKEDCSKRDCG